MALNKNDAAANNLWGEAYADVPKSVFAVVCYYFAQRCSDDLSEDSPFKALAEEINIIAENGIIDPVQAKRCTAALRKVCD